MSAEAIWSHRTVYRSADNLEGWVSVAPGIHLLLILGAPRKEIIGPPLCCHQWLLSHQWGSEHVAIFLVGSRSPSSATVLR